MPWRPLLQFPRLAGPARAVIAVGLCAGLAAFPATVSSYTLLEPGACAGPASDTRLYVTVTRLRDAQGVVAVTLYPDDRKRFLARRGSLYVARVQGAAPTASVCLHLPGPGSYAVGAYHDRNANGKFDRTGIGLPAEDYGFSNNPKLLLGPPSFKSVRITVNKDGEAISIRLNKH